MRQCRPNRPLWLLQLLVLYKNDHLATYNRGMDTAQIAQNTEQGVVDVVPTMALDRDTIREELWQDVLTHPSQKGAYFVTRYAAKYGVSRRTVYSWLKSLHKAKATFGMTMADANRAATDYVETLKLAKERLWDVVTGENTPQGTKVQAIRSILTCEQKLFNFIDSEGTNPFGLSRRAQVA